MFNPINILMVDDDDNDRSYYSKRLTMCSSDYVVFEAKDGRSALHLIGSEPINCVVTELNLPDMSGLQLMRSIAPPQSLPRVAVIILAQCVLPRIADLARVNGAQACLMKRFTSGYDLDQLILRAMSAVGEPSKELHSRG